MRWNSHRPAPSTPIEHLVSDRVSASIPVAVGEVDGREVLLGGRDPIGEGAPVLNGHPSVDKDSVTLAADEGRRHR